ncbi:C39 family peptidase [Virgibacillus sp. MSP4-1]|uniref:C39 family peptidase n=1 Tax=Virgibacillus sp. MSP4-1 TaxID=2700081 RepID=UPI0003A4FAE9|nr:C39 family peptidase [Virgibacillus sp. MSP4-1]QHS23088.1 C39 family peptidase [Virgibacillus sp. MSP4-1]
MYNFLVLFCFYMSILLWKTKKSFPSFKKTAAAYSHLFFITALVLVMVTISEHKQTWSSGPEPSRQGSDKVNAVAVSAHEEISLSPIVEEVEIRSSMNIKAPHVLQLPELPRGCEVTSLTMLLQYYGMDANKMTLAKEITRDPSRYKEENGKIHFGNPHIGFVGNMYTFNEPGYGVYNEPLADLAEKYVGKERVLNLSGESFYSVIKALNQKQPVVVIINAKYKKLPASAFETWYTSKGPIKITMNEHSVLVTGYDEDYIYFNDPLDKTRKAPFDDFVEAWEQMGNQAITIKPPKSKEEI